MDEDLRPDPDPSASAWKDPQHRLLGLVDSALNDILSDRADYQRNLSPKEPRITCAFCEERWAVECFYFCCTECRDAYVWRLMDD